MDLHSHIIIKGAKENNLKNINLAIPKNKLIVLTGLSGSGKSSIAFDTLQTECQRQYMESMGMVTDHLSKPRVDSIIGLSPSISVDQRVSDSNLRSTVGTSTEVFTYLRLLFAKLGQRPCPRCGQMVEPPFELGEDDEVEVWDDAGDAGRGEGMESPEEQPESDEKFFFCPYCHTKMAKMSMAHFSFNKPEGACPRCTGLGVINGVNMAVLLDEEKSIPEGAVSLWADSEMWRNSETLKNAGKYFGFPFDINMPVKNYNKVQRELLLHGIYSSGFRSCFPDVPLPASVTNGRFEGIVNTVLRRYTERVEDASYREKMEKYMIQQVCTQCNGARLREESRRVVAGGKTIIELSNVPLFKLGEWLENLPGAVSQKGLAIAVPVIDGLKERIRRLIDVGVGYINIGRSSPSLSAGESQRLRLACLLGSGLTGVLYVLDEPTIGLHQRDTGRLIKVLRQLRDLGNTVLVIEHDMEMMRAADYIIDIGPGAGKNGGQVVAEGTPQEIAGCSQSVTGQCLAGVESVATPEIRRAGNGKYLKIADAAENNLKNIDVKIPLGTFTAVTGVSGSGKSTLMFDILDRAARRHFYRSGDVPGKHGAITGWENIDNVITIDQSPIGRVPRSNAATYTDAFTPIRNLFAELPESKAKNLQAKHFSFNVPGGRCERCDGAGVLSVSMHFLPAVQVRCPACRGKRFKRDILEIKYKGRHISDILNMTIQETLPLFSDVRAITDRLALMAEVGLGYLQLGQPATTLSGGEAQRIKLAKELGRRAKGHILYLLDEPTTGLHPYDVIKLISVLKRLVDNGNTVVVIEHNLDVIRMADYIIDIGPEGGDDGGRLIAEGTPEQAAVVGESITGKYLRDMLNL